MKSAEFLREAEVTPYEHEALTIEKAVEMLNTYCLQSRAMVNSPLWRGFKDHTEEVFAAWPETGVRQSQNTSNHYTEILDNSPFMRGWPARSKSFICSSSFGYANSYGSSGSTYAIFPFDNVEIAVCPKSDMWHTTVNIPQLEMRNITVDDANDEFQDIGIPGDYASMLAMSKDPNSKLSKHLQSQYGIMPGKLIPILFDAYRPEKLGFALLSVAEFANTEVNDRECWVSGPVVAIRKDLYEKFRSAIVKGNIQ